MEVEMPKPGLWALSAVLASSLGSAQPIDVPVRNWTVPPYERQAASGSLTAMADVTFPSIFVGVSPCRIVDTRNAPGPYGGPALTANVARAFDIDGSPCTGIPSSAAAYSLNFGAIVPPADGFLTAWAFGTSQPTVSQLNLVAGKVVANAAIVHPDSNGRINVLVNVGPTNIYIDINGYFLDTHAQINPGEELGLIGSKPSGPILFVRNLDSTAPSTVGILALIDTPFQNGSAIQGSHNSTSAVGYGVRGWTASTANGAAGVYGEAYATTGYNFGGKFYTSSPSADSAGVKGVSGYGDPLGDDLDCGSCWTAGVRGVDNAIGSAYGVLGVSKGAGVGGVLLQTGNPFFTDAAGFLGYRIGGSSYGVFHYAGSGGTGTKSFIEPHAHDPSKVIRYISLEGPEAGTYFRGRSRFERGVAVIDVPEDFRLVTDEEGLTVQVTPIGEMASVAVVSIGLDRIVVKSSRNVEFFYLVNGVRKSFKEHQPIEESLVFMPEKAETRIPSYLSVGQKELLIRNGTYRSDGTVNLETARRLGWDRIWERRTRQAPEPTQ
jgi:hypothetical protein